jgi:hypothetical protein
MPSVAPQNLFAKLAGKLLGAVLGLFIVAVVLLLGFVAVFYFNENFFELDALLFLIFGLALLWENIRRHADSTAAFVLDFLALPFQLLIICGSAASILLSGAARILPESWEWPADSLSRVVAFESGKKAALLYNLPRIQVYDADGRYSNGWFLESPPSIFKNPTLYKNEYGIPGAEETIVIHRGLEANVTIYDLDGKAIGTREQDYDKMGYPFHGVRDFPAIFPVAWYQWPLAAEVNALMLSLIGIIGAVGLMWVRRFFEPRKKKDDVHE